MTESISNEPTTHATTERDAIGRFQRGNPGGPGNPLGGRAANLRRMLFERLSDEALAEIVDRVIAMATEGHWQAIKLLLSYILGKPSKMDDSFAALESTLPAPADVPEAPPEAEPSTNGVFFPPAPPAGGSLEPAPGRLADVAPLTNGILAAPRNRKERRALYKAQRIAQRQSTTTPTGP